MYYSSKWYKETKKLFSLILAILFTLSTLTSSVTLAQVIKSPLQNVILEAMALETNTQRQDFVDEILEPLDSESDVTTEIINKVTDNYFTMNYIDTETSLTEFSKLSDTNKMILKTAILEGLPDLTDITGFENIKNMINEEITGEPDDPDNKGLRFLIKLIQTMKKATGSTIAKDDTNDNQKIILEFKDNIIVESTLSSLIDSIDSIKKQISSSEGDSNLDKLLSFYETKINENSHEEINSFKVFLRNNGNLYEGIADDVHPSPEPTDDNNDNNNDFAEFNVQFDPTDKANSFIEFKTTSEDIYTNTNKIEFRLNGKYKDNIFPVELSNQYDEFNFLNNSNCKIIESNSSGSNPITLPDDSNVHGYIRTPASSPGGDIIGFEINLPNGSIHPDKTYKIYIDSEFYNAVFSSAINSVIKLDTESGDNFEFRLIEDTHQYQEIHSKRMEWQPGQPLSVKELTENSDFITLIGDMGIKYPFEVNDSLSDIKGFNFYLLNDINEPEKIKSSYESLEAKFGETSASSITSELLNENSNLKLSINFENTLDFSTKKELTLEGEAGLLLNNLLKENQELKIFIAATDSNGDIKAWKNIKEQNTELIIDPKFMFNIPKDESENNIPYVGYHDDTSNINGTLEQTGDSTSERIIVDGVTTYESGGEEKTIPFILSFDKEHGESQDKFSTYPRFENKTNSYAETIEDIESGIFADVIPVYPFSSNDITLTYTYKDKNDEEQKETITFQWERGELDPNELWGWATTADNFWGIGPNSYVDVKIFDLQTDDLSKLKLKGTYTRITGDDITTLTLLQLAETEDVTSIYENKSDYNLEDNAKVIRFSYKDGDINELYGDSVNDQELKLHLEYLDDKGTPEIEDDIENSQEIMHARVDNQPPEVEVKYNGLYEGEKTALENYHSIVVRFHDEINIDTVTENQKNYFSLQNSSGEEISKAFDIEGYRDEHEGGSPDDPYRSVVLYFSEIPPNSYLNVKNISDKAGNKISEPISKKIEITGRVSGHVQYPDGTRVSNARVDMVLIDSVLNADFTSGKPDIIHRTLDTDANGVIFDTYLDAGNYKAYRVEVPYTPRNEPYDMEDNIDDGMYDDGMYDDGMYDDGMYDDGMYDDGMYDDGMYDDGMYDDGMYDDGMYDDGMYDDGMYDDGMYDDGMYDDGMYDDGMYDDGMYDDGMYDDGMYDDGMYDDPQIKSAGDYNDSDQEVYIDQDIEVKFTKDMDDAQEIIITVPDTENVTGTVLLDPDYPEEELELLVIKTDYLNSPWNVITDTYMLYEFFGKRIMVSSSPDNNGLYTEGTFNTYLEPGEYKVVGKTSGMSYIAPISEYLFTVPETGSHELTEPIEFPKMNVIGKIVDFEDAALDNATVVIRNKDATGDDIKSSAMTNSDGLFATALEEGSYTIPVIEISSDGSENNGIFTLDISFDVNSDGEVENVQGAHLKTQTGSTLKDIQLPETNLNVKVTFGTDEPVDGASLELVFGGEDGGPWIWSNNGMFDFFLEEGEYKFAGVGSHNMFIEDVNYEFIVDSDGNVLIPTDVEGEYEDSEGSIIIDLTSNSNAIITIQDENGNPIADANIGIEGINNGIMEWRNTDANGKAYFNLEQGKYRLPGYNDNTGWHQLDEEFVIGTEKFEKTFKLKLPNVKGTIYDDSNNPIKDGWFNIQKIPGENDIFAEYFGGGTDNEGYFSLFLDPGKYVIEGIGTHEKWQELNFKFFVEEDKDGNLITKIEKDGELETVAELEVKKPADNIKGKVYKNASKELFRGMMDDDGYDPNWSSIDVWLVLKQANVPEEKFNQAPWVFEKWIEVDSEGNFGTLVDESKEFIAEAVVNRGKWITLTPESIEPQEALNNGAIVPDENTTLTIIPPEANFSGTIKDYNNNPVGPGWINVEKINSEGNFDGWYGMQIESNGTFSMTLEEGQEYMIRDASIEDTTQEDPWMNSKYYSFNKKITIGEDSKNINLKLNTKFILDLGKEIDSGDFDYYQLSAQIRKIVDSGDDDYQDYQENPWKYETWANMDFDSENGVYEFTTHLDKGNYILTGIPTPNGYIDVNYEFTVDNDDQNLIEVDANPNVTGIILDDEGNGVPYAWVDMQKIDNTNTYNHYNWDDNRWFGTNTDQNGEFSLKLKDSPENGYYRINAYNTQGYWQGYNWIPGERVEVNYIFKVIDGNLMKADGVTSLERIEISTNVVGTFMQIYKEGKHNPNNFIDPEDGEYSKIKDAWLTIKPLKEDSQGNTYIDYSNWDDTTWANTSSTGYFNLMLGDGEYMVIDAGTYDNWFKLEIPFEIKDGKMSPNNYLKDGVFEVKPPEPNMSGTLYRDPERTETVEWGWFSVKPASASDYDWSNVKWFNTDKEGHFSGYLPQGNWKITEISGPGYWERVNIPLSVDSSESISSPWDTADTPENELIVQEDGSLTISPREPNVTGILKDKNGNILYENAQVTIKPTSDSEHDWSNVVNCEYKYVDGTFMFQTKLDPGEYKVVNIANWNFWYETNTLFKVNSEGEMEEVTSDTFTTINVNDEELTAVIVEPPEPNVTGTVYSGETTSSDLLKYGWIGLARFDSSGNQLTMDGDEITPANGGFKSPYDEYYWNHTRWTGTNENGNFEFSLNDGIYKFISVNGMNDWYQPEITFIIENGILKNTSGDEIDDLTITKPGANMILTIKNSNADESFSWLDILNTENGNIINVESDKKDTEGNFVFEERLKEGTYSLVGFYSSGIWEEIESDEFTVPTDGEFEFDFNKNSKINVTGELFTTEDTEAGSGYWISIQEIVNGNLTGDIKQVQSNSSGEFEIKLDPEETWAVVSISNTSGVYKYSSPESYTVKETPSSQKGWSIILDEID